MLAEHLPLLQSAPSHWLLPLEHEQQVGAQSLYELQLAPFGEVPVSTTGCAGHMPASCSPWLESPPPDPDPEPLPDPDPLPVPESLPDPVPPPPPPLLPLQAMAVAMTKRPKSWMAFIPRDCVPSYPGAASVQELPPRFAARDADVV